MPLLTHTRNFEEPVLAGRRTTMIRSVRCRVPLGHLCTVRGADQRTFIHPKVLRVRPVAHNQLTRRIALSDGRREGENARYRSKPFYPGVAEFLLICVRLVRGADAGVESKPALRETRAIRRPFGSLAIGSQPLGDSQVRPVYRSMQNSSCRTFEPTTGSPICRAH